jgi:biotin carboxylase
MDNVEKLSAKYAITEDQALLLSKALETKPHISEGEMIVLVTNVIMLTERLIKMGFKPTELGCEQLVSCIPRSTRSNYSENCIDAAIEYTIQRDS